MSAARTDIAKYFGRGDPPSDRLLVNWDGFDQLEKEDAVAFYAGKTWIDLYRHLRSLKGALFGADYRLEEWAVLTPGAQKYYLLAFLEYLLESVEEANPDDRFVSDLFFWLYEATRIHDGEMFSHEETEVLRRIAIYTREAVNKNAGYEEWQDDIAENINRFLAFI